MMPFQISVCGVDQVEGYAGKGITHLLSIDNPGAGTPTPGWFLGTHRHVFFHDILTPNDPLLNCGVKAPTKEDAKAILDFGAECIREAAQRPVHLLVHCRQGASRSPAAAFAIMALALGPGREKEALDYVLKRRDQAFPNVLVVKLAGELLNRKREMVRAMAPLLQEANKAVNEWMEKMRQSRPEGPA